jgi:hypothetical protein
MLLCKLQQIKLAMIVTDRDFLLYFLFKIETTSTNPYILNNIKIMVF